MALIANNISGSASNASRIGITGSVIFANNPGSSFPSFPNSTVTFFVSGSNTQTGADNPSIVLKGDSFVSGAFGVSDYIQMKPVGSLSIPTNTSASYIYTSGSTNDLYFTQYQPGSGYTNTTRLRWLESVLATGLLFGGRLSTANGTTTFSAVSGSGLILSQNASEGSDPYPTITNVSWGNILSQSLTFVASDQITYITVDSSGIINQSPTPPTIQEKSSNIYLGRILHQAGSVTNGAINEPSISYGLGQRLFDFQRIWGPLKVSGHILTATASNGGTRTLGLNKTAGDSFVEGRNYTADPNSPNYILAANDAALTTSKIFREYIDGSGDPVILTNSNVGYEEIDPSQYNTGGSLASVGTSEWSNQRVYWFPRSVNRALFVYYGQQKYSTLSDALSGLSSETFTEGENTQNSAVLVGVVTAKGNETDITNTSRAKITLSGLSRGVGVGGGGGGGSSTSPGGLNTYVQFNDSSTFGGDAEFVYNKTTNVLTVGDVSVGDSGLISTAGTTATIFNTNATTVNFAGAAATALNIGNSVGTNTVSGRSSFPQGLSGSLTKLTDGTSYLVAGSGIQIVTGSSGAITITNDGTVGDITAVTAGTGLTGGGTSGAITLGINDSVVATVSGTIFTGDVGVNGGDITTTSTTFNLVNSNATTINFAGGASALNLGTLAGTNFISGTIKHKTHTGYSNSELNTLTAAVSTTNSTPTTIYTIPLTDEHAYWIEASIVARQDGGTNRAYYTRNCLAYRTGAGAATIQTGVIAPITIESNSTWDATLQASGNNILVRVTGSGSSIYWVATIRYQAISTSA